MSLSPSDWNNAIKNVHDIGALADFGYKVFQTYYAQKLTPSEEAWYKTNLLAFARLLEPAFVHMRLKRRRELRKYLVGRGKFFEPVLQEDPATTLLPHMIVEDLLSNGVSPVLLELLVMGHDIEAYLRPSLLRLLWIAEISDGSEMTYRKAMLKDSGEQGSIKHALDGLRKWIPSNKSKILPKVERRGLREFILSLKSSARDQINVDELRNWVDHRDFMIRTSDVVMHYHRGVSDRKKLKLPVPRTQVTQMRRQMLGLVSLLKGFEGMFRAHEAAPARRRKPVT